MPVPAETKKAAQTFAAADYASWTATAPEAFVGASDALFFGNEKEKMKPLATDKLPKNIGAIAAWIEHKPSLKTEFDKLDAAGKVQALAYVAVSITTRAAKDALVALPNGEAIRKTIDGKIEADYGDGDKTNKFKAKGFDSNKYLNALVESAINPEPTKLTIKGAEPKVAAWQEAMNEYAKNHGGKTIAVDGAWRKETAEQFNTLGGDVAIVLSKLKKDGIVLHPEHFEVAAPGGAPASKSRATVSPSK